MKKLLELELADILADDMVLGETVTMLANIVATFMKAAKFQGDSPVSIAVASSNNVSDFGPRATLFVVLSHNKFKQKLQEKNSSNLSFYSITHQIVD